MTYKACLLDSEKRRIDTSALGDVSVKMIASPHQEDSFYWAGKIGLPGSDQGQRLLASLLPHFDALVMWGEVSFGNRIDSREPLFRVIEQRPHVELVALGSKLLIFCAKPLSDEDFHSLEASLTRETSLQAHLAHWSSLRCWIEREQNNQRLKNVAEAIILEASRRKPPLRIGTAESCTGGLVGHLLTTIPGSSAVFQGGIASYSNELKARLLGVDPLTIERVGAVSAETAQAMAKGARDALSVDVAVSVTGIAGPSGGTPEKPVGLVFVGCSIDDRTWSVECRFDPSLSRTDIQERSACRALELLHEALRSIRH